jgi:hypothetical protein
MLRSRRNVDWARNAFLFARRIAASVNSATGIALAAATDEVLDRTCGVDDGLQVW